MPPQHNLHGWLSANLRHFCFVAGAALILVILSSLHSLTVHDVETLFAVSCIMLFASGILAD